MGKIPKWLQRVRMILKELESDNVRAFAAQSAYFLILSAIPLLMLVIVILQTFLNHTTIRMEMTSLQLELLPSAIGSFLTRVMNEVYQNAVTIVPVSILTAIWASSKGMTAITLGLNHVYRVEESRNYIMQRLRGMLYVILFLVGILVSMILLVFGNKLSGYVSFVFPFLKPMLAGILENRVFLIGMILFVVFMALYKFMPNCKKQWRYQVPGAIFSVLGWLFFSFGFSVYVDYFSGFSDMYGSMTTIILLMLWLYWCMYIVLLGGKINYYFEGGFPWKSENNKNA